MSEYEKFERSFSGFETQDQAEFWLEEAEIHFKTSRKDWKDWTITTSILRQDGQIKAEFTAVHEPQEYV